MWIRNIAVLLVLCAALMAYLLFRPVSAEELCRMIHSASVPIRPVLAQSLLWRFKGLPRKDFVLVSNSTFYKKLNFAPFEDYGSPSAGVGISLWAMRDEPIPGGAPSQIILMFGPRDTVETVKLE